MKKGIVGEGLMEVASILLLVGIIVVFYILFVKNISYTDINGIKQIISSDKIISDGGITLRNLLNTPVDNIELYEFILLNKDNEPKIKEKVNELMSYVCKLDREQLIKEPENVCFWDLKIRFTDKIISLGLEGLPEEFENKISHSLALPDYNNNLVLFDFSLYKGLKKRLYYG